jgi:hypothetical protein
MSSLLATSEDLDLGVAMPELVRFRHNQSVSLASNNSMIEGRILKSRLQAQDVKLVAGPTCDFSLYPANCSRTENGNWTCRTVNKLVQVRH